MSEAIIVPSSDVTSTGASWSKTPGANFWSNVDESGAADDASYNQAGADGTFECLCTSMPTALAVASLALLHRVKFLGAATAQRCRVYLRIGGTRYNGAWVTITGFTTETNSTHTWTANPATGLAFTPAEINAMTVGWEYADSLAESVRITQLKGTVTYTPLPPDQGATRDAASRKLFLRRMPQQYPTITGPLWLLDLPHHTQVDLHHYLGISESGQGWEPARWKRGLMSIKDVSVDPMTNIVTLRLRNDRRIRCLMYDSGWAKQGGAAKNGLMRFTNGATWTFTRASAATFTDFSGDSVTVQNDVEAYAAEGQEFLAAAGARAVDRGYYSNNAGARTWCAQQMSARFEVTPDWNGGSAPAVNMAVAYVHHDANNYAFVYYNSMDRKWYFAQNVAGTPLITGVAHTPAAGTRYVIGVRCTGSRGELGLAPYTASIFVNGVKGTDVVHAAAMTEAATSTFDIGSAAGTVPFRGRIRRRISRQIVLTDTEMARSF